MVTMPLVNVVEVHDSQPPVVPDSYGCPECVAACNRQSTVAQTYTVVSGGFECLWATCSEGHIYMLSYARVGR